MKTSSISQWVAAAVNPERGVHAASMSEPSNAPECIPAFSVARRLKRPEGRAPLLMVPILFISAFTAHAQVNLPIGNLAPGERITLFFDVTLTNPFPAGVVSVTNQGTITGSNFSAVNTDDPQTAPVGDATITVVDVPPTVITLAATGVTPTSATLNASVNPNGLATAIYFQFGLTTSYGSNTTTNNLGSGSLVILTNALLSNLSPGTLYHFRAVATNSGGTINGADLTFTTIAIPQPRLNNLTMQANGQFRFAFTNTAGQTFIVLGSTNVALPTSNWTVLGLAVEGPAGQFQFTDPQATTNVQRYYRVRWP